MSIVETSPVSETNTEYDVDQLPPAMAKIMNRIISLKENVVEMKTSMSSVYKELVLLENAMEKHISRSMRQQGKKSVVPSGFAKPGYVSDSMCYFMNVPTGTLLSRTECTKYINQYIKDNKLQGEEKKTIVPDSPLKLLLKDPDEPLTYFNIQGQLNHHFKPIPK